jgi:hypothetical protein
MSKKHTLDVVWPALTRQAKFVSRRYLVLSVAIPALGTSRFREQLVHLLDGEPNRSVVHSYPESIFGARDCSLVRD